MLSTGRCSYLCARATGEIHLNLTQIQVLGQLWNSDVLTTAYNGLSKSTSDANAGALVGNRMFYANDYMVRADIYVLYVQKTDFGVRFIAAQVTSPVFACIPVAQGALSVPIRKIRSDFI